MKKEVAMSPEQFAAIERKAHQMRAQEMQRILKQTQTNGRNLLAHANRLLHALFSGNHHAHHNHG